jgi:hypothetical protein
MAYESTKVPVTQSQDGIRRLLMTRAGAKLAFISDPPREGFEAVVQIDDVPYRIRVMAVVTAAPLTKKRHHYRYGVVGEKETTDRFRQQWTEDETRRIWRVLFYHLKSVFEAADSGVMEFRELMLPYIVLRDGRTIADIVVPKLSTLAQTDPSRLLCDVNKQTGGAA